MEKIYFTIEEMIDSIKKISAQLVDSNYDPEVIISVNRGGCIPGIYLSHYLNKPHEVINIELRDSNSEPDLISIKEKIKQFNSVLIIDDINDTGETFNYINKNFGGEDRVRTAAIIHNAPSKFEKLNYYCYGIDKDVLPCWIVFRGRNGNDKS